MKNYYIAALSLLVLLSSLIVFLTSKPVIYDELDSTQCNCSGPKAFKSRSITDED
jgi:hypothetical protein